MAVRVSLSDPDRLIIGIREAINDEKVTAWSIDKAGDLSLTIPLYKGKAWMRPRKTENKVIFNILGNKQVRMTKGTYAAYHSKLAEMILRRFDDIVDSVSITPNLTLGDRAGGSELVK